MAEEEKQETVVCPDCAGFGTNLMAKCGKCGGTGRVPR